MNYRATHDSPTTDSIPMTAENLLSFEFRMLSVSVFRDLCLFDVSNHNFSHVRHCSHSD